MNSNPTLAEVEKTIIFLVQNGELTRKNVLEFSENLKTLIYQLDSSLN